LRPLTLLTTRRKMAGVLIRMRGSFVRAKLYLFAVVSLAVALLTPAAQAHSKPSLSTVLAHTRAADRALDRAVAAFEAHALAAGRSDFGANRRQIGQAVAEKAKLIQAAATPAERLAAAKAVVAVARQALADELALARAARDLRKGSKLQVAVVRAAAQDTARSHALAVLEELLASAPDSAQTGLAKAVARLTQAHGPAVVQLGRDVTSRAVGATAKASAAAALVADVRGQARAINLLEALKPLLPEAAQAGLDTALAAIAASLDRQANALAAVEARAPDALKAKIAAAIAAAHSAADDARA
jgi:hypothetical protein